MSPEQLQSDAVAFRRNRLLARLDSTQFAAITSAARVTRLEPGRVLHAPNESIEAVYFPLIGTVSLVAISSDGRMVEAATIGNEGTTAVPLFLAGDLGPLQVIAQVPGEVAVAPAAEFRAQLRSGTSLDDTMRRYTHAQMVQTAQTALCNRLHDLEERAARWLLQTHDRVDGDRFGLTHEFLSIMLGVHRPTVTLALGALAKAGLLAHSRGQIEIVDREGLEQASCECYEVIAGEYERLFPTRPS